MREKTVAWERNSWSLEEKIKNSKSIRNWVKNYLTTKYFSLSRPQNDSKIKISIKINLYQLLSQPRSASIVVEHIKYRCPKRITNLLSNTPKKKREKLKEDFVHLKQHKARHYIDFSFLLFEWKFSYFMMQRWEKGNEMSSFFPYFHST